MSPIYRRQLLAAAPLLIAGATTSARGASTDNFVETVTRNGRLRGFRQNDICIFRGIPYAGPASGAMRFRPPTPPVNWVGVRDALKFGPRSIQSRHGVGIGDDPSEIFTTAAEDCLTLNVWTPTLDGRRRPVMVYSHGGGYSVGGADAKAQDGSNLARLHDVVVVEANHRLGLLGYLFLADILGPDYPGNQGLLDIVAALQWIHDNIAAFGGDPDNVMIFGESGGGGKTSALYAMPAAIKLFHKASIESGAAWRFQSRADGTATALAALKMLNIPRDEAHRLLDVPVADLLAVQDKFGAGGPILFGAPPAPSGSASLGLGPIVDGTVLPANPFSPTAPAFSANKPLMVGNTSDERVFQSLRDPSIFHLDDAGLQQRLQQLIGANAEPAIALYRRLSSAASPTRLYLDITRDAYMWSSVILVAERKAAQHAAPVYVYELSYASPTLVPGSNYPLGSPHASDIYMKFDNIPPPAKPHWLNDVDQSLARYQTAINMSTMWANFARGSHPSAPGQPDWPSYTPEQRNVMFIDAECHVEVDPRHEARLFWQKLRPEGEST